MNFPSDRAIEHAYTASGYRSPVRKTLEAAYAIDEPKIRADQTRKIVEALHEYEREDLAGIHVVLPADFIERKFGI